MKQITPDVLLRLNIALASGSHFSQNMEKALEILGKISRHDRINIIEVHHNMTYTVTHSWNTGSLKEIPPGLKHNKLIYAPALERQLCTQNHLIIRQSDGASYPDLATLLEALECCQMLLLPLFGSGSKFAFISFLQCSDLHTWSDEEIKLLGDLSTILALQMDAHQHLKQISTRFKEEKKRRIELEIKQNRLSHWLQETRPVWEQFKSKLKDPEISEVTRLEKHFTNLDRICSTPSIK